MGARPYWYFVKYEPDAEKALQKLRQREFLAGRYNPVLPSLEFPIGPGSPAPGAGHASIEEAVEAAGEEGTGSILDLVHVGESGEFLIARLLSEDDLEAAFETTRPTRAMVERLDIFDELDRGTGVCVTVYKDGKPDEYLFAGYSVD